MTTFTLSKNYTVVCEFKKTRTAFKHVATILHNGSEVHSTKVCYQNRTWESYEFQTVLHNAINGYFKEAETKKFIAVVDGKKEESSELRSVAAIAALGEIFGSTQKEKNDWKKRMLLAGLENKGLSMPDDWNELSEDEKQRRLDGAIAVLK